MTLLEIVGFIGKNDESALDEDTENAIFDGFVHIVEALGCSMFAFWRVIDDPDTTMEQDG